MSQRKNKRYTGNNIKRTESPFDDLQSDAQLDDLQSDAQLDDLQLNDLQSDELSVNKLSNIDSSSSNLSPFDDSVIRPSNRRNTSRVQQKKTNKKKQLEDSEDISPAGVSAQNVKLDDITTPPKDSEDLSETQTETLILPPEKDYIPFVISLPITPADPNIFDLNVDMQLSSNIDYPLFSLGFHHYMHLNKNKMEILNEFEGKKKVYLVMNKFERYVDNYPDDIGHYGEKFFDIGENSSKGKPDILSRGFYKLWEIFHMFGIIDLNKNGFISAHLAEGPGSFIQATMFFRDKYSKNSKNDKYYAVTLHPEDEGKHVPNLEKSFIDFYEKEKPLRFILHKTYSKQVAGGSKNKDNGDITNPKTINLFGGQIGKDRADLITADGGFDWDNENTQEQEALRLIFAQIYTAFKIQAKSGNFICKFFETFTDTSLKLIYMLTQMYDQIYVVKPLTSRASNSEKYIVCLNFRHGENNPEYINIMKKLESVLKDLHNNPKENLVELWPSMKIPDDFRLTMIYANTYIANRQLKSINEIVEFIKDKNYYGDVYQMHRQMQIDANKYWISMFMPNQNKFIDALSEVRKMTSFLIQKNSDKSILPKTSNE